MRAGTITIYLHAHADDTRDIGEARAEQLNGRRRWGRLSYIRKRSGANPRHMSTRIGSGVQHGPRTRLSQRGLHMPAVLDLNEPEIRERFVIPRGEVFWDRRRL